MNTDYSYNKRCLLKNGQPWFPVMGEMHFSRYREDLWEESLRKIKAGGVEIVSSYVIWIHHEEEEGIFDFSGCRSLKNFLSICQKIGISVFLRLGPWAHGEVRNGGFPDWLLKKDNIQLRSNDMLYLGYVRQYWEHIYNQAKGFMHKNGGPIIGIQIENEYGHVGGLRGEAGEAHMRTLTAMAKEIGFDAPFYTATGWGGACIGDLLPVMGGYCEAPWDQRITELEPNANFVFSYLRNDSQIACDHHIGQETTFDESLYPYLTAELGGGIQVTSHRRPVARGKDIGAMSIAKLGSGASLLGYYMYHGGSNPKGKLTTLQESRETGYANDLPEINYDFNAPIRQYGTISDTYREIRLLALFLQDFGAELATMETDIQPPAVLPNDLHTLRLSCRHNKDRGYIFFNNYQRRYRMKHHSAAILTGIYADNSVQFPPVDIHDGDFGFFPYRMKLGNACLHTALATPLCRLKTEKQDTWIFYGNCETNDDPFCWEGDDRADIILLSKKDALLAGKITLDQDYLILADGFVWEENGLVRVTGENHTTIRVFPEISSKKLSGFSKCGKDGRFTIYERIINNTPTAVDISLLSREEECANYQILLSYNGKKDGLKGRDTLLNLSYSGDKIEIYANGEKINDHFYTGQDVPISLRYFNYPEQLEIIVYPLYKNAKVFLETWPDIKDKMVCNLDSAETIELYW